MRPSLGLAAAALLFSGAQAGIPRLFPRAEADVTTTPEPETTTSHFPLPFESSTTESVPTTDTTGQVGSTSGEVSSETEAGPTETAVPTTDISIGAGGEVTISGVITVPSASLPTGFQPTGTAAFVGVGSAATNAANSFSDVADAASAIASNPSPSAEEIEAFQKQAQDEFEDLSHIDAQLKQIDLDSLSEDDSHKVEKSIAGLAALLAWYSTQLSAIAPVVATPALATGVFAELAPAFAAVAAGELLSNALDDIKDFDNDDGDNDNDDDDDDDDDDDQTTDSEDKPTSTQEESTIMSSTETATTTSSTGSCSALPYRLELPDEIDEADGTDNPEEMKRSIAGRVYLEERGVLVKRARSPYFGDCKPAETPKFPTNPNAKGLDQAEQHPKAGTNGNYNRDVQRWYDRKVRCEEDLRPGWEQINTAEVKAQEKGLANFNVDHVWELKFFTDFFETQLLPGGKNSNPKLTCDEFNAIFPKCILTTVVNQVPGPNNAEFVAMHRELNNMKGAFFKIGELEQPGFIAKFEKSTDLKIEALQTIGISVDIFNQGPVKALFERTNQRLYNTFRGIDNRVRDNKIAISGGDFSFAELYESFMADRLDRGTAEAWQFVQHWSAEIESDIKELDPDDEETQKLLKNYDGFVKSPYAAEGHYSFLANRDLAGAGGDPMKFAKRDLWARDGSCPLNEPETTSEEATSTAEQTSTEEPTATTTTSEDAAETTTSSEEAIETTTSQEATSTTFSTMTTSSQVEETTTEQQEPTSTQDKPSAQTVTTNGMVCVLIEGSNNPVCQPLETPVPNPDGTNVHVQKGCILINNSPRCASDAGAISGVYESSYNVASSPDEPYGTVLILSGFDANNDIHLHSTATCQLQARWPANYGDVTFGEDGCLYDAGNNKIFDQCCSSPDPNNSGPATNPYVAPAPGDASQDHGDHDGSAICRSISKDTCLLAASRYVDDIVYHQYTSAVWPDDTGKDIANMIFPIAGPAIEDFFGINYGCTVIWTCDNDDAFSRGMTGKQIKDSMLNIYNLNGAKGCGSTYLNNGCHITVNGCNNCEDRGRGGTIWNPYDVASGSYGDASDGFPPRR
ncbi:hypothetical protein CEP54_006026 [Fusarium duplospermum]|uniref:Uncharacterized protein n=1 Tax=Fusarium duplospermum TaxID=1325734 RepID=A0A428Q9F6_9HYPO|nr:hypothetical protein CEP54_006026 [Fusarium duplospermum]